MQVQNIECQITAVLMKRFLDGENLPDEIQESLETHLRVCPECRIRVTSEQQSLIKMLDSAAETAAVLSKASRGEDSSVVAATPAAAISKAMKTTTHVSPAGWAAFKNPKVLGLSFALAVVLIAMTTIMRNPTALLGGKASEALASSSETKSEDAEVKAPGNDEESSTTDPEVTGEASHSADSGSEGETTHVDHASGPSPNSSADSAQPEKPQVENDPRVPGKPTLDTSELIVAGGTQKSPSSQPPVTKPTGSGQKAPAKKSAAKPRQRNSSPPKSGSSSGVKVYDANGKQINP
ncbi:zf-HC2 domain-containing protein [Kamptonema cortianum]|nr:zf-HC2 domain-containing protein [Geitlerinema splendidum]MDK3161010.1 zf-HC2 domain-containing protein [Kamptonema cortianum]